MWNTGVLADDGSTIFIKLRDAGSYLDDAFGLALDVYHTTEQLGVLPFSGGWAEQPEWILVVLKTLKTEQAIWENEQMEKERNKK